MAKEIKVWSDGTTDLWSFGESVDIADGYVEVPTGDHFLTRKIKELADAVYVRMKKNKKQGYSTVVGILAPPHVVDAAKKLAEQSERSGQILSHKVLRES